MDYHPDITKRYFNVCLVLNSDTEQGSKVRMGVTSMLVTDVGDQMCW